MVANQTFEVFHGKEVISIELPESWGVHYIPMPDETPLANPEETVVEKLKKPSGSSPLSEVIKPGSQVAICTTDTSRPCPDYIVLPPLLEELHAAGVERENITILIAVGAHRQVTLEEMRAKFGYNVVEKYRILNHDARNQTSLVDMGKSSDEVPRIINSLLTNVDHIISLGVVDLHQYAGFSGGAKTIAVGCAGEETIRYTHSAAFLEKSGAIPGRVKGNLFQQALWEIVQPLPFTFAVNMILNEKGEILELDAGKPKTVHENLVEQATQKFIHYVDIKFDIAYLGVPHPKDVNLYQATRAATYQALSENSVFEDGAIINLICSCPEGFGQGVGERRFREKMTKLPNPPAILLSMTGKQTLPGEQRAFMVAKTMLNHPINVFGTDIPPDQLRKACFKSDSLIPEGAEKKQLKAVVMKDGSKKVLVAR